MLKQFRFLASLIILVLVLAACQSGQQAGKSSGVSGNAGSTGASGGGTEIPGSKVIQAAQEFPAATLDAGKDNPAPVVGVMPTQSQAAGIQPKEMRAKLMHLSNLIGYQVLDKNGSKLGVASDFIVNTCETYIIYILMDADASLNVAAGSRVLIPFEVVTINSGVFDAQNKTIQLQVVKEQFAGAPTLANGRELTPTDWEGATVAFWKKWVRIAVLRTSCNAGGAPSYKVAYATQLLKVELYDWTNNLLGTVQEAILEPESGQIGFYVIKPAKGEGLVMVSLGVTNIPKEALAPGAALKLVILTAPVPFWDAPRISSIDQADNFSEQGKMRQYWKQ